MLLTGRARWSGQRMSSASVIRTLNLKFVRWSLWGLSPARFLLDGQYWHDSARTSARQFCTISSFFSRVQRVDVAVIVPDVNGTVHRRRRRQRLDAGRVNRKGIISSPVSLTVFFCELSVVFVCRFPQLFTNLFWIKSLR